MAADPVIRHRALARHQAILAAASDALHHSSALWAAHYRSRSSQTRLGTTLDQARGGNFAVHVDRDRRETTAPTQPHGTVRQP
ncbi:hypothetical protein AB0E12_25785 [Micromonospora chersina]|uniref:hypothetical protein n=1 Tax=Micromonospora chersina TaxID=47854 RepID=UPI0033DA8B62